MRRPAPRPPLAPASLKLVIDPRFQAALVKAFDGHQLEQAAKSGSFALGIFERDRAAAELTLAEMEADPVAFRARFGGRT